MALSEGCGGWIRLQNDHGTLSIVPKVLGIIPAGEGSKGIPFKNGTLLLGKPLIAYTIEQALQGQFMPRLVVSTDSKVIGQIAKNLGAEVPFLMPPTLAGDETPTLPVLQHAVRYMEDRGGYKPDVVVTLQPTSPLRCAGHIDEAVKKLLQSGADSVISVCEVEHHPYWMYRLERDRVVPLSAVRGAYHRRQDLPTVCRPNGAIYVTRWDVVMNRDRIIGDDDVSAIVMDQEVSVDIDLELDLRLAELILQKRQGRPR